MAYNQLSSFGIHQVYFQQLSDPTYSAIAKILDSAESDLAAELIPLTGGSAQLPWGAAPGTAAGTITLPIREYSPELLRFLAPWSADVDTLDADGEASGSVSTPVNAKGTSVIDSTTGIATIAVGTASSLKPGTYKAVATAAATIDLYLDNDLGGNLTYQDNKGKINDSAITITSGGDTDYLGLTITGGSGTIGMTAGDIATFTVNPASSYLYSRKGGLVGTSPLEFKMTIFGEKVNNKIRKTTFNRCIASSDSTIKFLNKEWAAMEASIQVLQPLSGAAYENTFIDIA
jgi:hypothetical protein